VLEEIIDFAEGQNFKFWILQLDMRIAQFISKSLDKSADILPDFCAFVVEKGLI
jgi:hypothetical protein